VLGAPSRAKTQLPNEGDHECLLVLAANGQHVRYDILAHLKKIQALLSVYDALKISAELRMSLVYANPEEFSNEVNQVEMRSSEPTYAECLALITFTDDYLQPGLIKHNIVHFRIP